MGTCHVFPAGSAAELSVPQLVSNDGRIILGNTFFAKEPALSRLSAQQGLFLVKTDVEQPFKSI